jgi:RNA 3'-terminal phosphate cyclase (ATP)
LGRNEAPTSRDASDKSDKSDKSDPSDKSDRFERSDPTLGVRRQIAMLTIDGSQGEGGGQIVRSSLALALVTGQPLTVTNVRAGRRQPGLMRQHLAALDAAAQVGRAEVRGAAVGSTCFEFQPHEVVAGDHEFRVGSAGSATLVLQTVLPALLLAKAPSALTLEGGTHNPWAPPFDFLAKALLPLVRRMGPQVEVILERPGFYPAGGGRFSAAIRPSEALSGFELLDRGEVVARKVRAITARLPTHIAERECQQIARQTGWDWSCFHVEEARDARGPGNVVMIELECERVTEVFTGFGQRGVRAEEVADGAVRAALAYLRADVPVGPHLADQLMLPLGVSAHTGGGGGAFRTTPLSRHSTTHADILRRFLDVDVSVESEGPDACVVRIRRKAKHKMEAMGEPGR